MRKSKDDYDDDRNSVNSPLKPVDHPNPEDNRGLMRDDKGKKRLIKEEKDQKVEDPPAEPLHNMDACIQGLALVEKMKEEFSNPEDFQEFLKCLHIYSREIITREELQLLMGELLGASVDLMKKFNDLLSLCDNDQECLEESCESSLTDV